jgi:hypothetical protein
MLFLISSLKRLLGKPAKSSLNYEYCAFGL